MIAGSLCAPGMLCAQAQPQAEPPAQHLRSLDAAEASRMLDALRAEQAKLRDGGKAFFHLSSGAPASYDQNRIGPRDAFVALDMRNAFPSLDRDEVMGAVGSHAPSLLPYAKLFLGRRSFYRYLGADGEGEALPADAGVDQGDPLAPAFLAVTIRTPLEWLEQRLRELAQSELGYSPEQAAGAVRVHAYLDDLLVRVPASLAAQVPTEAAAALEQVGGALDTAKTQVWRAEDS